MKKFFKMFNIFELNLSQTSYKSPIIRIAVSLLIMIGLVLLRLSITIPNIVLNMVVSALILIVIIMSVLCFFIAAVECLQVGENREKKKRR